MQIQKLLAVLAAPALSILVLSGCGGDPPAPAADANATAPAETPKPNAKKAAMPKSKPVAKPAPPKQVAAEPPVPIDDPDAELVALVEPAFVMVEAPDYNHSVLGSAEVVSTEYLLASAANSPQERVSPRVPNGLTAVPGTEVSDDGFALKAMSTKDRATMVLISEGQYQQGADSGPSTSSPQHTAYVSAFYIDVREVTVGQFQTFMDAAREEGTRVTGPVNLDGSTLAPAVGVSYRDAQAYAEWAGKQIPTESQWEKAARGPMSLPNVWGKGRPLWAKSRTPGELHDVASYPSDRSVYGVFDMAGNAREWCRDFWDAEVYEEAAIAPGGVAKDFDGPRRPRDRALRVVRGTADSWSVIAREGLSAASRDPLLGFRCVLEFDPDEVRAAQVIRRRSSNDD